MSAGALVRWHRLDLLQELIFRDVRLRYRGRVLGLLWSQIGPITSVIVFSVVFSKVIPLDIPNYPVFIFIGVEAWQWFSGALAAGSTSVVANRDLVRHPGFPVALLPPFVVGAQLTYFVLGLPVILGATLVLTGRIPATSVYLPFILMVQFTLCIGCAYVLAALQVFLRDTAEILSVVLRLMFFVTPIIYDESRLRGSRVHLLFDVNPMAHLITAQRDVLLIGRSPDLSALAIVGLASVVLAVTGHRAFVRFQHRFPDEI